MRIKEFAFVGIRLFSIYLFVRAIVQLSAIVNYLILPLAYRGMTSESTLNIFLNFGPLLVLLLAGFILWLFAGRFSSFLISDSDHSIEDEGERIKGNVSFHEVQVVAFSVVGLVLIVLSLPEIVTATVNLLKLGNYGMSYVTDKVKVGAIMFFIEKLLKLGLGIALLFGSKGLVGFLKRIRDLGVKEKSE